MARGALERSLSYKQMAESFTQQVADQKTQVDNLKSALNKLEQKLTEAQNRSDLLVAQQRRARVVGKATDAHMKMTDPLAVAGFDRMKNKVMRTDAVSQAKAEMAGSDSLEDKFTRLEKEDEIERLLQEMKSRQGMSA